MASHTKGEHYYKVPHELANSLAFRNLPTSAKTLWHDLMMQYRGNNNGNINATLSELRHYNSHSATTIAKGLRYLIAHGFIKETRMGGNRAGNLKLCCLYAFTHIPTNANPKLKIQGRQATYDYRNYDPTNCIVAETLSLQKMESDAPNNGACRTK